MQRLDTFADASSKVLADIQRCLIRVQALSAQPFETASAGVGILQALRRETYEDLNQIQHEHLILRAAQWLLTEKYAVTVPNGSGIRGRPAITKNPIFAELKACR